MEPLPEESSIKGSGEPQDVPLQEPQLEEPQLQEHRGPQEHQELQYMEKRDPKEIQEQQENQEPKEREPTAQPEIMEQEPIEQQKIMEQEPLVQKEVKEYQELKEKKSIEPKQLKGNEEHELQQEPNKHQEVDKPPKNQESQRIEKLHDSKKKLSLEVQILPPKKYSLEAQSSPQTKYSLDYLKMEDVEDEIMSEELETENDVLEDTELAAKLLAIQEVIIQTDLRGEELLWLLIQRHENEVLVFINHDDCVQSQEVLSILLDYGEPIPIRIANVSEISEMVPDFGEALEKFTKTNPPIVFYKSKFVANYSDILNGQRFHRLDLILEPPRTPWYHIIIIGSGPGAQAIITEVERLTSDMERHGKRLKIALVDWTSPVPYNDGRALGLGPHGNLPRNLLWNAIRESQASQEINRILNEEELLSEDLSDLWDMAGQSIHRDISTANLNFRKRLAKANIDFFRGTIEFIGKDILTLYPAIENSDSSSTEDEECTRQAKSTILKGMNIIICGGTLPRIVEFPGFDHCVTIDSFLYEENFPSSALIIGNTPEVFETAHLIASYGGEVTVMNKTNKWLPKYDQGSIEKVLHSFKKLGVKFLKITKIVFVREIRSGYKVRAKLEGGKHHTRTYVTVIMDYTRVPISTQINVEEAGVTVDCLSRKIVVNKYFRTTNEAIWAFGSVARGHMGTPHFEMLAGRRVINLILRGTDGVRVPKIFPRVLLTPLEYAFVGMSEKSAKLKYRDQITIYEAESHLISYAGTNLEEPPFQIKIICTDNGHCSHNEKLEHVIGIHFLGRNASRLITGFASALEKGLTKREFIEQVSISGFAEMGLFQTELTLRYVSGKIPCSQFVERRRGYSLQCKVPYRFEKNALPTPAKNVEKSEVALQPDANLPIATSSDTDLWSPELEQESSSETATTDTFPMKLRDSSTESTLACDHLDREPSCTTIYTCYTRASELCDRLTSEESSDTDSDDSISQLNSDSSSAQSLLDGEESRGDNRQDGSCSSKINDTTTEDEILKQIRFNLIFLLLPVLLSHSATYCEEYDMVYGEVFPEYLDGELSSTDDDQDKIDEIESNSTTSSSGQSGEENERGNDEIYSSSEESGSGDTGRLPLQLIRINHFIHDE